MVAASSQIASRDRNDFDKFIEGIRDLEGVRPVLASNTLELRWQADAETPLRVWRQLLRPQVSAMRDRTGDAALDVAPGSS